MTALATASLAVVAWIIARIALASGSRGKSGLTAIAAPPTHRFSSVYVAGSRPAVTRTGLVRIAVRPGSQIRGRLPRGVRQAWEEKHPQLAATAGARQGYAASPGSAASAA